MLVTVFIYSIIFFIFIGYPQSHFEQSTPVATATAPLAGQPVISIPPNGQPASYAPPPFLVPPPQFIPPQTPASIINYVSGPNGPAFQPNYQGYQGYSPPVQVYTLYLLLKFQNYIILKFSYAYFMFYSHSVLHLHKNCSNHKVALIIVQLNNNNNQLR